MKRAAAMVVGALMAMASLTSASGAVRVPERIVDPGLHRQWRIERDTAHPERPARLIEMPWSVAVVSPGAHGRPPRTPVVRAGMKVTLRWRDQESSLRLAGTALESGRVGEMVRVCAGLHGAVLRGVVRGPALVELERGRP